MSDSRARDIRRVRSRLLDVLKMALRNQGGDERFDRIAYVQRVMLDAVNDERERRGFCGSLTIGDLRRIEQSAIGLVDYSNKFALYCAEAAIDPEWKP